jgi:hypothetical protein
MNSVIAVYRIFSLLLMKRVGLSIIGNSLMAGSKTCSTLNPIIVDDILSSNIQTSVRARNSRNGARKIKGQSALLLQLVTVLQDADAFQPLVEVELALEG